MSGNSVFRSIIVPVDGSKLAEAAIPYALAIAAKARSKLRFVLVHEERYQPLQIDPANVYIKQLTRQYEGQLGSSLSSIIITGRAAPQLVQHAGEIGADLVVMSTHGWGGLRRAWLGSVADELIRSTDIPVMVVRPRADESLPVFDPKEILVPLDGSNLAEAALGPAADLARLWDAELALVQAVYPLNLAADPAFPLTGGYDSELTEMQRETAAGYVRTLSEALRARGIRASGVALSGQAPVPQCLIELAAPGRVSLVAIATHGRGGFRRLVLGSVSDKLVRAAEVPVLVIPAKSRHNRYRNPDLAGAGQTEGAAR
jgi:nucleotide-binding universal stress UspA family protein